MDESQLVYYIQISPATVAEIITFDKSFVTGTQLLIYNNFIQNHRWMRVSLMLSQGSLEAALLTCDQLIMMMMQMTIIMMTIVMMMTIVIVMLTTVSLHLSHQLIVMIMTIVMMMMTRVCLHVTN